MPYFFSHSSGSMPNVPSSSADDVLAPCAGPPAARGSDDRLAAEVDLAVQLEPVDAGLDLELELAGLAVELAVGLDVPAPSRVSSATTFGSFAGASRRLPSR